MPISFCTRTIIPITPASLLRHRRRSFSSLHLQHTTTTSSPPKPTLTATAPTPNPSSHQNLLLQTLSSRQKQQISLYVGTLLEWNQRMNLTAVKEEEEVMTRHVEDSLAILPPLRCSYISRCGTSSSCEKLRIIDVGTGAGIPGLIFAVACPGQANPSFFVCRLGGYTFGVNAEALPILGACRSAYAIVKCADFMQ